MVDSISFTFLLNHNHHTFYCLMLTFVRGGGGWPDMVINNFLSVKINKNYERYYDLI